MATARSSIKRPYRCSHRRLWADRGENRVLWRSQRQIWLVKRAPAWAQRPASPQPPQQYYVTSQRSFDYWSTQMIGKLHRMSRIRPSKKVITLNSKWWIDIDCRLGRKKRYGTASNVARSFSRYDKYKVFWNILQIVLSSENSFNWWFVNDSFLSFHHFSLT